VHGSHGFFGFLKDRGHSLYMLGEKILLEADFYVGQALRVLLGVTEADGVVILVRSGILAFNVRL
jgi:hypothetical protein